MKHWIFLTLAALFFGSQQLLAQMPLQAVTFDQFDNNMMGTKSDPFPIDLTTIAEGTTVSFFQSISSSVGGPESAGFGAAVAWLENGTDIKAITFAQDGAGPLVSSGVLDLGTASGTVTDFLLGGREPQTPGLGAVVVWVENGVTIKAVVFDALGGTNNIYPLLTPIPSANPGSKFFRLTGSFPESGVDQAVVAWVDADGVSIKAYSFYQNGVAGGVFPLVFATASTPITDFQLTGQQVPGRNNPELSEIAIAWVENGGVAIYQQVLNCGSKVFLGSASVGTVENFQLVGDLPGAQGEGGAVAWIEGGVNFKAVTFDCECGGFISPILDLGSAGGVVSGFQLTGGFPESEIRGAAIAWIENGTDAKAIVFDAFDSAFSHISPTLLLGSASAGNVISNFRLSGMSPEVSGFGAAVAWTEGGRNLKSVTFNANPSTVTSTISPIISLGTAPSTIIDFALTGAFPEEVGNGAALTWLGEPIPTPPGSTTPRSWKRPSNPRVR